MHSVIIVDDDKTNTKLIGILLEMDGFRVTVCPDTRRAKQAAANGADAFIIDCNLSDGDDGIDLLKEIRAGSTAAPPEIPIIMISGDDRRFQAAEEAGATGFLLKPYSTSALSEELSNLLA
jgi:two-component system chemotaxis response regulator CheY